MVMEVLKQVIKASQEDLTNRKKEKWRGKQTLIFFLTGSSIEPSAGT